jgi:small nuclear ribonucleoprotein (snRNP)-like protein
MGMMGEREALSVVARVVAETDDGLRLGKEGQMAEATTTKGKGPTPEKFRAHGVQNDWLNKAKGKSVEVRLTDGQTRSGRLAEHDIYCLALEEARYTRKLWNGGMKKAAYPSG